MGVPVMVGKAAIALKMHVRSWPIRPVAVFSFQMCFLSLRARLTQRVRQWKTLFLRSIRARCNRML